MTWHRSARARDFAVAPQGERGIPSCLVDHAALGAEPDRGELAITACRTRNAGCFCRESLRAGHTLIYFGGASVRFIWLTPAAQKTMHREGRGGGGVACNADVGHDRPKGRRTLVLTGVIPVCRSIRAGVLSIAGTVKMFR